MSSTSEKNHLGLAQESLIERTSSLKTSDLETMMLETLEQGVHGLSFSPYVEGQAPAIQSFVTKGQIIERMSIISPYTSWVRSFSCTSGNEQIPEIAHSMGIKTLVGAWIADDLEKNELEIENLIRLAKDGHADILAVGNEVLLRGELTESQIIQYIERVKEAVPNIPVGYVDAYYIFEQHQAISDACDVILANCYPYWEHCALSYSVDYMKHMYEAALRAAKGKKVIIAETGWPNKGSLEGAAEPGYDNAMSYFLQSQQWAISENIELFYFSSFDEAWKIHHEGASGAHWGLWDKDNQYKYSGEHND